MGYDSVVHRATWIGMTVIAVVACHDAPRGAESGAPEKAGEFRGIAVAPTPPPTPSAATRPMPHAAAAVTRADAAAGEIPTGLKTVVPY